jgi:hypothetical protein
MNVFKSCPMWGSFFNEFCTYGSNMLKLLYHIFTHMFSLRHNFTVSHGGGVYFFLLT